MNETGYNYTHLYFRENEANQLVNRLEFAAQMDRRRGDPFWKSLLYIQNNFFDINERFAFHFHFESETYSSNASQHP